MASPLLAAAGRNPSAVVVTTSAASVGRRAIDICLRLELGQVEQVPDEPLQPPGLGDDHVGRLGAVLYGAVLNRLGEAAD